jgi:nucleotide-binding universal stress UspA family protein
MALRANAPRARLTLAYQRIIVPLVADLESEAAMALAAGLAADRGSTITAVVVVEVPAELPLEAHMLEEEGVAKRTLEAARAIGNSRGVNVRTKTLRARLAGEAIVAEAKSSRADLVVLRAPRKQGRGGKVFGRTVEYVLRHAPCRVMVAAPPPSECAKPTLLT